MRAWSLQSSVPRKILRVVDTIFFLWTEDCDNDETERSMAHLYAAEPDRSPRDEDKTLWVDVLFRLFGEVPTRLRDRATNESNPHQQLAH